MDMEEVKSEDDSMVVEEDSINEEITEGLQVSTITEDHIQPSNEWLYHRALKSKKPMNKRELKALGKEQNVFELYHNGMKPKDICKKLRLPYNFVTNALFKISQTCRNLHKQ